MFGALQNEAPSPGAAIEAGAEKAVRFPIDAAMPRSCKAKQSPAMQHGLAIANAGRGGRWQ